MDLTISELNNSPVDGLNYSSVETVPGIEARAAFTTQLPRLKNLERLLLLKK